MGDFSRLVQRSVYEAVQIRLTLKEHLPVRDKLELLTAIQNANEVDVADCFEVQQYLVNCAERIGHAELVPREWLLRA